MNIDEHPSIAGQLGIQSIPAVIAFVNGQPVDGFMGALPESQVKAFIDRSPARRARRRDRGAGRGGRERARGRRHRRRGRASSPRSLQLEPENRRARIAGLAELPVDTGDLDRRRGRRWPIAARSRGRPIPRSRPCAPRSSSPSRRPVARRYRPTRSAGLRPIPDDHQARFDLALALERQRRPRQAPSTICLTSSGATATGTRRRRASSCCSSSRPGVRRTRRRSGPAQACRRMLFS